MLTGSYRNEDGAVVLELYGRTRDDKSVTLRVHGFEPYFHVVCSPDELRGVPKGDEHVRRIERVKLYVDNVETECTKVTLRYPWMVPNYRDKLRRSYEVLAADIPFVQRFMYDKDMGSCVRVHGEPEPAGVQARYTTELVLRAQRFEPCEPFKPSWRTLCFDIENSIRTGEIYVISYAIRLGEQLRVKSLVGKEAEIINGFKALIAQYDPDIITGYNIDGYDLPKLIERARYNGIPALMLGRDDTELRQKGRRYWKVNGRLVVDAWLAVKRELRPKQETLNHVAKLLLNEQKKSIDPLKIDEEWTNDRQAVLEYCETDALLALKVLEKIRYIEKAMDLATVSKLTVEDVVNGMTSTLIDSLLIREADRHNIAVPCIKHKKGKAIVGGYVHAINPGLYHWVCLVDFKAMYPSLIIANNICFTTLSGKGTIVSPTGVRFSSKSEKVGLLPGILKRLMSERDGIKSKMKRTSDPDKLKYYDGLQAAIKTLMNAFYGVFASSFYRFTNREIGGSITAFARENIKAIIAKLEQEDVNVIYSDTDSIFFQSKYADLEDTVKFGTEIAKRFSKAGTILEFEQVIEPLFTHGKKKRYVGKVIWPEAKMVVRGYEIRRTDAFDLQSEALSRVFEQILDGDIDDAVKTAKDTIKAILSGNVPVEKLTISKSVKAESSYKSPDAQANVQAARKLSRAGYEVVPGMKVSWVVTNGRKTPQELEPYIDGVEFKHRPDYCYYAERVALSLSRVTEVFGISEGDLLAGTEQKRLTLDFKAPEARAKKTPPAPRKSLRLEDFM